MPLNNQGFPVNFPLNQSNEYIVYKTRIDRDSVGDEYERDMVLTVVLSVFCKHFFT